MDNSIKFIGYFADGSLKQALKNRKNPMALKTFYSAVNQACNGCSCCKNEDAKVYAIQPVGIVQIKPTILSLCSECYSKLPTDFMVINLDNNGTPPALIYRWCEV